MLKRVEKRLEACRNCLTAALDQLPETENELDVFIRLEAVRLLGVELREFAQHWAALERVKTFTELSSNRQFERIAKRCDRYATAPIGWLCVVFEATTPNGKDRRFQRMRGKVRDNIEFAFSELLELIAVVQKRSRAIPGSKTNVIKSN